MLQGALVLFSVAAAADAVSVGGLIDGAPHSGTDRVAGLPLGCLLLRADADLQVTEFSRGKAGYGSWRTGGGPDRAGTGLW
ncbi:hypothetical protein GCM10010327_61130 [Streptomyces nitrosporeus]|nr:hypothetical protein GCM10010327_61130 [Streptomyces nitrosporeus]